MWQREPCVIERMEEDSNAKKHIFMNAFLILIKSKHWFNGSVYKMIEVSPHA